MPDVSAQVEPWPPASVGSLPAVATGRSFNIGGGGEGAATSDSSARGIGDSPAKNPA